MMQWKPVDTTNLRNDAEAPSERDQPRSGVQVGGDPADRFLLDAAIDAFVRLGARSVVVMAVVAVIVATLVFGLGADNASAMVQWCPRC